MVRSRGASWSAMRSLLRTGFWLCAGPATTGAGLVEGGAPESNGGVGRLWSGCGWESEQVSWGELVFEVYSSANCRIILWRISRATTGMCGSEKFGTSEKEKNMEVITIKCAHISVLKMQKYRYTRHNPSLRHQTHLCGRGLHWEIPRLVSLVCWLWSDL